MLRQPMRILCKNRSTERLQANSSHPLEYLAVLTADAPFVHRTNADGTIDSFCRKCFLTVASSQWEAELEHAESNHKCDPIHLEYMHRALDPPQNRTPSLWHKP
jgi:hypothetical protein